MRINLKSFPKTKNLKIQILKNASWIAAQNIINIIVNFLVNVYVVRYLGAESYGAYMYALSIVAISSPFSTLGIDRICLKEITITPEHKDLLIGTAIFTRMSGALITIAITILWVSLFSDDSQPSALPYMCVVISLALLARSFLSIEMWFQSKLRAKSTFFAGSIALAFTSAYKLYLILNHCPLRFFAWTSMVEAIITGITMATLYIKAGNSVRKLRWNRKTALRMLKESWSIATNTLVGTIYSRIDKILLGAINGMATLGVYTIFNQLLNQSRLIFSSLNISVNPELIKRSKGDTNALELSIIQIISIHAQIALYIALLFILFGNLFASFIFGEEFTISRLFLIYISATFWIQVPASLRVEYLVIKKKSAQSLYLTLFGLVVNVIGILILIRPMGTTGVALAILCSTLLSELVFCRIFPESRSYSNLHFAALFNALTQRPIANLIAMAFKRSNCAKTSSQPQ